MVKSKYEAYRNQLLALSADVRDNVDDVSDQARIATGGEGSGGLSNAPMHLADMGSEAYTQELNSTLLETEVGMAYDIAGALQRIDQGTFGICEQCGTAIPAARLDALPYTRYCVTCSDSVDSDPPANLNTGRPQSSRDTLGNADNGASRASRKKQASTSGTKSRRPLPDSAAGTAGGGTESGGLAGTNSGHGDPEDVDLERATASGLFDSETSETEEDESGYSGADGGAIGGTPAGKRESGGKSKKPR